MIKAIGNIGKAAMHKTSSLRGTLAFAARVFLNFFDRRTYNSASRMVFIHQFYFTSVQILPLFLFVAVIFGSLINGMAFQVVKNLGLTDYLGRLLMGFVVTELSPFVTVLLIALRSSSAIDDPLSRLIASGLAVRHGLETEVILRTAVETASRNGWKRALLAWLERLKSFHEAAGDVEKASAIRSRIDLILSI
jgi:hypothetical protein